MKYLGLATAALAAGTALLASPSAVYAQADKQLPPITLDLRDAPIRAALEQVFKSAKVDYSIDPGVAGFVTLKITDQPFENALRLILRSAQIPLTYTKESGVYIVKIRELAPVNTAAITPPPPDRNQQERVYQPLETIQLVYIDPEDLAAIIGPITIVPFNVRGNRGGGGGGFGGGGGGFGGGGFGGGGLGGGGLGGGGFGGGGFGGGRGF